MAAPQSVRARSEAVSTRVRAAASRLAAGASATLAALPPDARRELRTSLWRLRKVGSPRGAAEVFEAEVLRLLGVVTPGLAARPLPLRRPASARAVVAGAAGAAAATEELDTLASLVSDGAVLPATLPVTLASLLLALVVELAVAVSLRVNDLRAAGAPVDPQAVAAEVAWAMAGAGGRPGRAGVTRHLARRVSARMLSRWGRGIVPLAGVAYAGWDAQRTITAIASLPSPTGRVARTAPTAASLPALSP